MKNLPKPMSAAEIARLVGGRALGDENHVVEAVAEVSAATPKHAATFHNMKYAAEAAASAAGCLLIPPQAEAAPCAARSRVVVADPQAAFAVLLGLIDADKRSVRTPGISPRASVHPDARLGAGVSVGDFCVIEAGARVGDGTTLVAQVFLGANSSVGKDCLLYPHAVVREDCRLGDRVIVHAGAVIGADGFGFTTDRKTGRHAKIPQIGDVVVGDDVEIGANVTIDRATLGSTVIGEGTKVDNLVQLAHNVKIGRHCFVVSQTGIAGSTTVGDHVIFAGQAGVAGHLNIGAGAVITAQTGVMADVPPKAVLFGSPGRPHREAFKLQALYGRLPEIFERLKALEAKFGLGGKDAAR